MRNSSARRPRQPWPAQRRRPAFYSAGACNQSNVSTHVYPYEIRLSCHATCSRHDPVARTRLGPALLRPRSGRTSVLFCFLAALVALATHLARGGVTQSSTLSKQGARLPPGPKLASRRSRAVNLRSLDPSCRRRGPASSPRSLSPELDSLVHFLCAATADPTRHMARRGAARRRSRRWPS